MKKTPTPYLLYDIRGDKEPEQWYRGCYVPERKTDKHSGWIEPVSNANVEPYIGNVLAFKPIFVASIVNDALIIQAVLPKEDIEKWNRACECCQDFNMEVSHSGNITVKLKNPGLAMPFINSLKVEGFKYCPEVTGAAMEAMAAAKYH